MKITGTHYIVDGNSCKCKIEKLLNPKQTVNLLNAIIKQNQFNVVDMSIGDFKDSINSQSGYTITVTLSESHIALHTWPIEKGVQIDVFLCDYSRDNSKRGLNITKELIKFFDSKDYQLHVIQRRLIY